MSENSANPQDIVSLLVESIWKVCKAEGSFLPMDSEWKINYKTAPIDRQLISYLWFTQLPLNTKSDILYTIKTTPIFIGNPNLCQGVITKINRPHVSEVYFDHPVELELEDSETLTIRLINEKSKENKNEEYILKLQTDNY